MRLAKILLRLSVYAHRLAKHSPVASRTLDRLSLTLAFKAVNRALKDNGCSPIRPCKCQRAG